MIIWGAWVQLVSVFSFRNFSCCLQRNSLELRWYGCSPGDYYVTVESPCTYVVTFPTPYGCPKVRDFSSLALLSLLPQWQIAFRFCPFHTSISLTRPIDKHVNSLQRWAKEQFSLSCAIQCSTTLRFSHSPANRFFTALGAYLGGGLLINVTKWDVKCSVLHAGSYSDL